MLGFAELVVELRLGVVHLVEDACVLHLNHAVDGPVEVIDDGVDTMNESSKLALSDEDPGFISNNDTTTTTYNTKAIYRTCLNVEYNFRSKSSIILA